MTLYELVVIGSGPGGYIAAAKASQLGMSTAIIEKDSLLGGTCLHRGCIPTKFLLHTAEKYGDIEKLTKIGISCKGVDLNWSKIQAYKNNILKKNAYGVEQILSSNNVKIYQGVAQILDIKQKAIKITSKEDTCIIHAKNIILAVGSTAKRNFMHINISGYKIMNSDDILNIRVIPKSLTIIGGGVVGCEFASVFSNFGTKVSILENSNNILPMVDKDCRVELMRAFSKKNVVVQTNVQVSHITENEHGAKTFYNLDNKKNDIVSEYCLVAVGREVSSNLFSANVDKSILKLLFKDGLFDIDNRMKTKVGGIYAIGDCVNTPWLAHVASSEGLVAVNAIINSNSQSTIEYSKIPKCIYTIPSIAWCGLNEDQINLSREYIKISKFPFLRSGKASVMMETQGFVKLITDRETDEIIGTHIFGKNSTELIAEPSFAMQIDATVNEISSTIHAHPTLYESIYEASLVALNKPLHG